MAEQRDQIVRRVLHALEQGNDTTSVVHMYFDADREVVAEAARQTLEATREEVSEEKLAAVVDRELIEALRFPTDRKTGWLPALYLHRRAVTVVSALAGLGTALALLLL